MCDRVICTADIGLGAELGDVRPLDEARIRILTVYGAPERTWTCENVFLTLMFEHGVLCSNIKRFMFKHKTPRSNIRVKNTFSHVLSGAP